MRKIGANKEWEIDRRCNNVLENFPTRPFAQYSVLVVGINTYPGHRTCFNQYIVPYIPQDTPELSSIQNIEYCIKEIIEETERVRMVERIWNEWKEEVLLPV